MIPNANNLHLARLEISLMGAGATQEMRIAPKMLYRQGGPIFGGAAFRYIGPYDCFDGLERHLYALGGLAPFFRL